MDVIDRKILAVLQDNAALSVAEIGSRVGLSSTPCWKRIQRLEADGVIQKRVAIIDQDSIGLGISVFVSIETGDHSQDWLDKFAKTVTAKGYGVTNVVVMDHNGVVLMEKPLVVTSQPGRVVFVYRGPSRATYACDPDCSARVNLGDDPDVFDKVLAETVSRTTQALSAGASTSAPH